MKDKYSMFRYVIADDKQSIDFNKRILKAINTREKHQKFNMFLDPKFFYTFRKIRGNK